MICLCSEQYGWGYVRSHSALEGSVITLQWRHNGHDGISNHQPHHCLLDHLFRRRSKKTSKLQVTGLYVGNSPVTGEFPAQMASNAENVTIWWHHHDQTGFVLKIGTLQWRVLMGSLCVVNIHIGSALYILLGCRDDGHTGCMNARLWMSWGNVQIICHKIVLHVFVYYFY